VHPHEKEKRVSKPSRIAFTEHTLSADVTVSLDRAQVPAFGGTALAAARAFGNIAIRADDDHDDDVDRLAGDRPETTSSLAAVAAACWNNRRGASRAGRSTDRCPAPDMPSDPSASLGVRVFPGSVRGADALTDVVQRLRGDS